MQQTQRLVGNVVHVPTVVHGLVEPVVEPRRLEEGDIERRGFLEQLDGLKDLRLLLQQASDDHVHGGQAGVDHPDREDRAERDR